MRFSEDEQKMIKWLRRQHEYWRSTRMITLICSIGLLVYAVRGLFHGELDSGTVALFGAAAYGLSYSLGSWPGRPEVSLLLKLVDAQGADAEPAFQPTRRKDRRAADRKRSP